MLSYAYTYIRVLLPYIYAMKIKAKLGDHTDKVYLKQSQIYIYAEIRSQKSVVEIIASPFTASYLYTLLCIYTCIK